MRRLLLTGLLVFVPNTTGQVAYGCIFAFIRWCGEQKLLLVDCPNANETRQETSIVILIVNGHLSWPCVEICYASYASCRRP